MSVPVAEGALAVLLAIPSIYTAYVKPVLAGGADSFQFFHSSSEKGVRAHATRQDLRMGRISHPKVVKACR